MKNRTFFKVSVGIVAALALGSWWIAASNLSPTALSKRFVTALQDYEDGSIYEELLQRGADPNYRYDPDSGQDLKEQVTALIAGAPAVPHQTYPLIFIACQQGNQEAVRALLKHKVNVKVDLGQFSLLMMTIDCGHLEIVKILIDSGVDVKFKTSAGDTALKHAIFLKNEKAIALLKQAGATE